MVWCSLLQLVHPLLNVYPTEITFQAVHITWLNLREVSTHGVLWAHVDSIENIVPVCDPVRNTRQITGTGFKPAITELTTNGKITQGTRELYLPVSNMRGAPAKLEDLVLYFITTQYYCHQFPLCNIIPYSLKFSRLNSFVDFASQSQ